jgi:hypothetical protein
VIDRVALFSTLGAEQPPLARAPRGDIDVPALVAGWLVRGPQRFDGTDRTQLDALCRQIDVRRKVSAAYASGFKRLDPEPAADDAVVSGLVAVLLGNAARIAQADEPGGVNDGWALKCVNSALKALDLRPDAPHGPALRAWAMERLDAMAMA